jgi:hypothetical protein
MENMDCTCRMNFLIIQKVNFRTAIASKNYDRPKTTIECGIFKYFGSILTNDGRFTCEIKCTIVMAKAAFNKKRTLFTSTLELEFRKKLVKCYIWSIALYGAETWTLQAVDRKHLESFEMWCRRRMEKISWTDHVRNEEVLQSDSVITNKMQLGNGIYYSSVH